MRFTCDAGPRDSGSARSCESHATSSLGCKLNGISCLYRAVVIHLQHDARSRRTGKREGYARMAG